MNAHIIGYGGYIPCRRIKGSEIARAHNADWDKLFTSIGVHEKSVPAHDEDAATLAVEAASRAVARAFCNAGDIGALFVGSESHPYAVKPTATMVAHALGVQRYCYAADLEFACKAGTAALITAAAHVAAQCADYALAIGADTAQSAPGDVLEYSAAAGGAAFVLGARVEHALALIEHTCSITTNTPDFWRRAGAAYPEHAGRFTAQPAYFAHVLDVAQALMNRTGIAVADVDHVVFHQPNGRFPVVAAKKLGFSSEQLKLGFLAPVVGNTYSAASLLGLCAVLDEAAAGQTILVVSYGSGSGADALVLTTTELLLSSQSKAACIKDFIAAKRYVDYQQYRQILEHVV